MGSAEAPVEGAEGGKMDNYKDLIERLRTESLYKDKATLEIMDLCMEAADALEALGMENCGLKANAEFRAITPPGFAKAFFEANR